MKAQSKSKPLFLRIINLFIVLTVLALIGILYVTLVRATITIPAVREKITNSETFILKAEADTSDTLAGEIITREYERTETIAVETTSTKATRAGGTVTIVNNYSRNQTLVRTTRLLTDDGKLFRISSTITVPAGGSMDVFAEADAEGDEYLIEPTTFTIPGLWEGLQDKIFATSDEPMSYDRPESTIVSVDDLKRGEEQLRKSILDAAYIELSKTEDRRPLKKEQITVEILSASSNPPIGAKAASIKMTVRARVSAILFDPEQARNLAHQKLLDLLTVSSNDAYIIQESFTYSISQIDLQNKEAKIKTEAAAMVKSAELLTDMDTEQFARTSVRKALELLEQKGIAEATIKVTPSFIPWMPLLADHITITAQ